MYYSYYNDMLGNCNTNLKVDYRKNNDTLFYISHFIIHKIINVFKNVLL